MKQTLKNGCEIFRGHATEVGLMQTEEPGEREAWLFWMEGQSLTSEREWRFCTRVEAVIQINIWLEMIGLSLSKGGEIVEF